MYNFDPKHWGKAGWKLAHYISLAYPDNPTKEEQESMYMFFKYFGLNLPCWSCRVHYNGHWKKLPLTDDILKSREKLIKWVIDLHNEVNISLGKPTMSYEDAINMYMYPDEENGIDKNMKNLFILLVIFVIIIFIYKKMA